MYCPEFQLARFTHPRDTGPDLQFQSRGRGHSGSSRKPAAGLSGIYRIARQRAGRPGSIYRGAQPPRERNSPCATAAAMGLGTDDLERLRVGSLLHDIGKIGVSDVLLQKAEKLTEAEFAAIKEHPTIGRRILEGVHGFAPYLPAVELHHENWNGTGYPHGQVREQTPVDARIIHVVDAYDAMTTNRPYRKAMTHEQAIWTLREKRRHAVRPAGGRCVFVHSAGSSHGVDAERAEVV